MGNPELNIIHLILRQVLGLSGNWEIEGKADRQLECNHKVRGLHAPEEREYWKGVQTCHSWKVVSNYLLRERGRALT